MDDKYIGKMLGGRYEVLELIGVGGMAYVYKARCHRLNRFVALKILKDDYAKDEDFRHRFHDESHAVAMLSHSNIAMVYDLSRSEDVEYIVMELVDGITLKQYMQRKGILTWREALHFVIQIVKALSHAHSRGIIHRDIKPHNIMLLRDGSVKVADFGIARFASKQQNTLTQEALGSVHYISPEQAKGSRVDARSDLYSVGVVLYEMLTGRLPFEGDTAVSVVLQHIQSLPLSPGEINPEIPDALEMITVKAMAPALEERYASAGDMLADLEEFRKNPSVKLDYNLPSPPGSDGGDNRSAGGDGKSTAPGGEDRSSRRKRGGGQAPAVEDAKKESLERRRIRRQIIAEENHRIRGENNFIAIASVTLAVLIVLSVLGYYIYYQITDKIQPSDTIMVDVPGLVGTEYSDDLLALYQDFTFDIKQDYNEMIAEGLIISQDPRGGGTAPQGSILSIVVSLGKETFPMPDVMGKSESAAISELTRLKLLYVQEQEHTNLAPRGEVFRTEPVAGTQMRSGDLVTIFVSLGLEVINVPMPSLIGMDTAEALSTLASFNLRLGNIQSVESNEDAGTIVWQSVSVGDSVQENTQVDVQISLGPVEAEETPPPVTEPPVETPAPVVTDPPVATNPPAPVVTDPPVATDPPTETPAPVATNPPPEPTPAPVAKAFERNIEIPRHITGLTQMEIFVNDQLQISDLVNADDLRVKVTITAAIGDIIKVVFDGNTEYSSPYEG